MMGWEIVGGSAKCERCFMYESQWHHIVRETGVEHVRVEVIEVAFGTFDYSHELLPDDVTRLNALRDSLITEARRFREHPDAGNWIAALKTETDATLLLVFADWLQENGFALIEAGVRATAADIIAAPRPDNSVLAASPRETYS